MAQKKKYSLPRKNWDEIKVKMIPVEQTESEYNERIERLSKKILEFIDTSKKTKRELERIGPDLI